MELAAPEVPEAVRSNEQDTVVETSERVLEQSDPRPAVPISEMVISRSMPEVDHREQEPIARPLKIAFGIFLGPLEASARGLLMFHFPHSAKGGPHRVTVAPSTEVWTRSTTTSTLPTAPKPSAEAAAAALVSSWSTGNRLAALSVATPAAATTLFGARYTSGMAIDRGCSSSFTPIVCTFGPPGGASPNDPIYQILVSKSPGGWYVSSVKIEN